MIKVQVRSNEPLEAALRRFKRQCNYAGVFRLAKKYTYFEKASDKNRREDRERVRNIQRAIRKAEERLRPRGLKKSKVKAAPAPTQDVVLDETVTAGSNAVAGTSSAGGAAARPAVDPDQPASANELAEALHARGESASDS